MTVQRLISGGVILILGLLVAYGLHIFHLRFTGYCFDQDKYLSKPEYIIAALNHIEGDRKADGLTSEDFLRTHPDCCSVDRGASSWFNNLLGFYRAEVEINYEQKPERRSPINYPYYTSYIFITACGAYGGRHFGESTPLLKKAAPYP